MARLFLIFAFLFPAFTFAQIIDHDVTVYGQERLDTIRAEQIRGTLHLQNVHDLTPLLGLTSVQGLTIRHSTMEDLHGLDSLKSISGMLVLDDLEFLTSIEALEKVDSVKSLHLNKLPLLPTLQGLEGSLTIAEDLKIERCDQLQNLDALYGIFQLDGTLYLFDLPMMQNLDGLGQLSSCQNATIAHCGALKHLDSLANLNVHQSLEVSGMSLQTMNGFAVNRKLKELKIRSCFSDTPMTGWSQLEEVEKLTLVRVGDFDMTAFSSLTGSLAELWISDGLNLEHLTGLDSITEIEKLTIEDCPNLRSLKGLEQLEKVQVMELDEIPLANFSDLTSLHTIEKRLGIEGLDELKNLEGLEALATIGELPWGGSEFSLSIQYSGIKSLKGLEGLEGEYRHGIKLIYNDSLTDISALDGISETLGAVEIRRNIKLKNCCVLRPWMRTQFGGGFWLENNDPYCSREAILELDGVCVNGFPADSTEVPHDSTENPIDPIPPVTEFFVGEVFPNPATREVFFQYGNPDQLPIHLQFYDQHGRAIPLQLKIPTEPLGGTLPFTLPGLSAGIYYYRLEGAMIGEFRKLLILRE